MSQMIQILSVAGWIWTAGFLIALGIAVGVSKKRQADESTHKQQTHL